MENFLDFFYSRLANRDKFFQEGWGDKKSLDYLISADPVSVHSRPVNDITIKWDDTRIKKNLTYRKGHFISPFYFEYFQDSKVKIELPEECKIANIEMVLPNRYSNETPLVIHFAATGDEGFHRRRLSLATPLAKEGIGSVILENPFYGTRRPKGQKGVVIRTFSEFIEMSGAAADEGIALLRYFHRMGFHNLGVTGISMGGYIALTVAARSEYELAVSGCIPTHSGGPVYLEGLLSKACDWESLSEDLDPDKTNPKNYMKEIFDMSDLRNFSLPKRTDSSVIISAGKDGYIPDYCTDVIKSHWKDAVFKTIPTGHVGAFLFYLKDFRDSIKLSFELLENKK